MFPILRLHLIFGQGWAVRQVGQAFHRPVIAARRHKEDSDGNMLHGR